jgi:hypothetical protein
MRNPFARRRPVSVGDRLAEAQIEVDEDEILSVEAASADPQEDATEEEIEGVEEEVEED